MTLPNRLVPWILLTTTLILTGCAREAIVINVRSDTLFGSVGSQEQVCPDYMPLSDEAYQWLKAHPERPKSLKDRERWDADVLRPFLDGGCG